MRGESNDDQMMDWRYNEKSNSDERTSNSYDKEPCKGQADAGARTTSANPARWSWRYNQKSNFDNPDKWPREGVVETDDDKKILPGKGDTMDKEDS